VLGKLADATSILFVMKKLFFLPLIGLLTALLPDLKEPRARLKHRHAHARADQITPASQ